MVGSVGWLSSALFFPTVLHFRAGGLSGDVWLHFWISFLLAGSIAVAYGFILTQYLMLRAVYPEFWFGAADFRQRAAEELRCVEPLMRIFQTLAAAIPLMGAVIMVSVGPDEFTARDYGAFRVLVTLLILSGMFGSRLATMISRLTSEMIRFLVGPRQ